MKKWQCHRSNYAGCWSTNAVSSRQPASSTKPYLETPPQSISKTYCLYSSHYNTRSVAAQKEKLTLVIPKTTRKTFAESSFSVAGPWIWNKLPQNDTQTQTYNAFKQQRKTYFMVNDWIMLHIYDFYHDFNVFIF